MCNLIVNQTVEKKNNKKINKHITMVKYNQYQMCSPDIELDMCKFK